MRFVSFTVLYVHKRTCFDEFPDESFSCCIDRIAFRAHKNYAQRIATTSTKTKARNKIKINKCGVEKIKEKKKKMDYYLQIEGADIQFIILCAQVLHISRCDGDGAMQANVCLRWIETTAVVVAWR